MKALLTLVTLFSFPALLWAELKVEEVRLTSAPLGPTRPSTKVLPGDEIHVAFVVSGITKDKDGLLNIALAAELLDEKGKKLAEVPAKYSKSLLALGGSALTNKITFQLPNNFPAGPYRVRGVLKDLLADQEVMAEQPVEVTPRSFGAVRLRLASDAQGTTPLGSNVTANQQVFVVGRAVGFARKDRRIHVVGNLSIRDSAGNHTMASPISFKVDEEAEDLGEEDTHVDFNWSLMANRPGEFTVQIELRDEITKTTTVYELPLVVHGSPAAK